LSIAPPEPYLTAHTPQQAMASLILSVGVPVSEMAEALCIEPEAMRRVCDGSARLSTLDAGRLSAFLQLAWARWYGRHGEAPASGEVVALAVLVRGCVDAVVCPPHGGGG
jgi:hypothetical protein